MDEKYLKPATEEETQSLQDGASVCDSKHSGASRSSRSSAGAAAARARAEAARAWVTFAEREIAMKVDKARLEANLEALHFEKEAAAANAQAEVFESAAEYEGDELMSHTSTCERLHQGPHRSF